MIFGYLTATFQLGLIWFVAELASSWRYNQGFCVHGRNTAVCAKLGMQLALLGLGVVWAFVPTLFPPAPGWAIIVAIGTAAGWVAGNQLYCKSCSDRFDYSSNPDGTPVRRRQK